MSKRHFFLVCILFILLSATRVGSTAGSADFRDRLGTLETDLPLDARGSLGGLAVDALGYIYVANFRDSVWRIDTDGRSELLTRNLYGSSGNAVGSQGRLYQSNFNGNTVSRIERSGEVSTFATGLEGPVGVAISPDDTLFVCNCTGNWIARITPEGSVSEFARSDLFSCPNGITFGADDTLYITNYNSTEITSVAADGTVQRFATIPGGAGNSHIAFAKGFFYVTKIISNQLVKVAPDGTFEIMAGTGQPGHEDGPALEGSLFHPNGIAVDSTGSRLYVNTMIGKFGQPEPSRITLRTVDLASLSKILRETIEDDRVADVAAIYAQYKADPMRGRENTVGEMIGLGYNYLSERKVAIALELFGLNAASYPDNAASQYHLGEAYRNTQQLDLAREQYLKVLTIDPAHAKASSQFKRLAGD